jgi:ubiquinone/menaquinone biosynthesis C-methylase UbiE
MNRAVWLADVMTRKRDRFNKVYAPAYDEGWGAISASHGRCVGKVVQSVPEGGCILDAACGTGRFFPIILAAGRRVHGVDWSQGMLAQARLKHPEVETGSARLQDLPFHQEFDGVLCVDALENLPPEDWPAALAALRRAARARAAVYLTVELPESQESMRAAYERASARGWPVVWGELAEDDGYHYYPERHDVHRWLRDAALVVFEQADGDEYWHLLCRPIANR